MSNSREHSPKPEREPTASEAEIKSVLDSIDLILDFYSEEAKTANDRLGIPGHVPLLPVDGLNELRVSRERKSSEVGHQAVIIRSFDRPDLGSSLYEKQWFHISLGEDGHLSITKETDIYDPYAEPEAVFTEDLIAARDISQDIAVPSSDCLELSRQILASQPW